MKIVKFFDKIEDRIRNKLSRRPVIYSIIGSIGIVLLWRGIWLTADLFPFMTGPASIFIGLAILLSIGLLVSFFIGEQIIVSGIKEEKKIEEKTEEEIRAGAITFKQIKEDLKEIKEEIEKINKKIEKKQKNG